MTPKGFLMDIEDSCYTVFSGYRRNITFVDDDHEKIILGQTFFNYIYTTLNFEDETVTFNVKNIEGGEKNRHVMIIPTINSTVYLTFFLLVILALGFIVVLCLWVARYRR